MGLEHTHTNTQTDAHMHAHTFTHQVNPGSAGEAHWELWGWTKALFHAPLEVHCCSTTTPVIITNTSHRLFVCMWVRARVSQGRVSHLSRH